MSEKQQTEEQKIAQEKFSKYDFENDPRWKKFIEVDLKGDLPPNPSQQVLDDVKKIWYKQEIDPTFDTGIILPDASKQPDAQGNKPEQNQENQEENTENNENKPKPDPFKNSSKITIALFHFENFLKGVFLISTVYFSRTAHYLSLFIIILALYRQLKRPRWNRDYGAKFIKNEFAHNLVYMIPFSIFNHARNIVYFTPLMMHYWLGFCEYLNLQQGGLYRKGERVITLTRNNKQRLLLLKSQFEIGIIGWLIFLIFVWSFISFEYFQQNVLLLVFYVNFIRLKYMISINIQAAFYQINEWCVKKFANENSNKIVKWIYFKIKQFCVYLITFDKKNKDQQKQQEQKPQEQEIKKDEKKSE